MTLSGFFFLWKETDLKHTGALLGTRSLVLLGKVVLALREFMNGTKHLC